MVHFGCDLTNSHRHVHWVHLGQGCTKVPDVFVWTLSIPKSQLATDNLALMSKVGPPQITCDNNIFSYIVHLSSNIQNHPRHCTKMSHSW